MEAPVHVVVAEEVLATGPTPVLVLSPAPFKKSMRLKLPLPQPNLHLWVCVYPSIILEVLSSLSLISMKRYAVNTIRLDTCLLSALLLISSSISSAAAFTLYSCRDIAYLFTYFSFLFFLLLPSQPSSAFSSSWLSWWRDITLCLSSLPLVIYPPTHLILHF